MVLVSRFQTVSLSLSRPIIIMSNPFDVPTPPKKRTPNNAATRDDDDYEEMFPSARRGGGGDDDDDDDDGPSGTIAARMCTRTRKGRRCRLGEGTKNDTRYTRSADYHRSIDTEVRSSGNGIASTTTQSGGYFGRGEYEEEEEELEDGEEDGARFGTHGTNTQRSSYNSAMQTHSTAGVQSGE